MNKSNIGLTVALLIATSGGIFTLIGANQKSKAETIYQAKDAENNQATVQIERKTIVVDETGKPSEKIQNTSDQIETVMKKMTTYTNGEEYTKNRNELKKIIKDDTFFENYLVKDEDVTKNSYIDATQSKSKFYQVDVFNDELTNRYIAVAQYVPYKKKQTIKTLSDNDTLKNYATFDIKTNDEVTTPIIQEIKNVKGYNAADLQ